MHTTRNNKRNRLFAIMMGLTPILLIVLFELMLQIVGYGDRFSLFINHPDKEYSEYKVVNPDVGKKYFQKLEYTYPAKDIFLKKKPDNVFRIFVMGSSTVVGFPYESNLMFSRILCERLIEAFPDKEFEVVNTAITAINSFTLLDFMPQILAQKPDAILFYAGHNEFYGAFGAGSNEALSNNRKLINLHIKLMNFRVYQLTRNVVAGIASITRNDNTAAQKRGTLMARIVKDADIVYGSETYQRGIDNYRHNMTKIVEMVNEEGIPFFYSNLVSNIKDVAPFKSIASDELKGADFYFEKANQQLEQSNFKDAYENFTLARDYDGIRFRASSDINKIIVELAENFELNFVNTLDVFESNSPNRLVGNNLLTEHVHPNIQGQFLMAESFYKAIVSSNILGSDPNKLTHKPLPYFMRNYGFTQLDQLIAYHRIANLKYHWPFRDETKEYIDYRTIYKPVSMLDSLAFFAMANSDENLAEAHLTMAKKYEAEGDLWNAFKEYNALTKMSPYWSADYKNAANCLIRMNDLAGALKFFERSNKYEASFFAHFRAGEICLIKNDLPSAISHFQKAEALAADEELPTVLSKYYIALVFSGQTNKADEVKQKLLKVAPNANLQVPQQFYAFANFIPAMVKPAIDQAAIYTEQGKLTEAIELLHESIAYYETPIAGRRLGELYYRINEMERSLFFFNKVYNDFKGDVHFLHYYIIVNLSNNYPDVAMSTLNYIKQLHPTYPDLQKLQGYIDNYKANK